MIKRIPAPYSFVPLNSEVYIPAWHNKVSLDIPFEDGEDGIIEVKWHNVSPLIIRDGSTDNTQIAQSTFIDLPDGTRRYFIPGSSMKGMLRNVMAIMSFGKFSSFMNRQFGYRNISDYKYRNKMNGVRHGWLQKSGNDYFLFPCKREVQKIQIDEVEDKFPNYSNKKDKSAWVRNENIGRNAYPKIKRDNVIYRLFATGMMEKKRHELLIPDDTDEGERLAEDVWKSFFNVYEHTPDFDKYKEMLEKGYEIPVGYIREDETEMIKVIGMGKMLRYPFKHNIAGLVRKEQRETQERDLCETIFGWTDKENSIKGRVQVGNAFCEEIDDIIENNIVKVVLGEPRASYYPLYLKQDQNIGKHYNYDNEKSRISGWKRYRIHKDEPIGEIPQNNDNENTISKFRPLKSGLTFSMRISVHNLRKIEIGALLSAITFHHTEGVWHNIGGAKSFGYGKIKCEFSSIKLTGLHYDKTEYLYAFEEEMNKFTKATINANWISCNQTKTLVAIASEHPANIVQMMNLKEYTKTKNKAKNNQYFYLPYLENTGRSLTTICTEEYKKKYQEEVTRSKSEKKREEYSDRYTEIKVLRQGGHLLQAKVKLEELIMCLKREGIQAEPEQKQLNALNTEITRKEQEDKVLIYLNKINLDEFLNEKYSFEPRCGEYKVDSWKICSDKLKKWMKESKESQLTTEEQNILARVVYRLKNNHKKQENKEWLKADSKIWKEVSNYLSKERVDKLINNNENYD